MIERPIKITVYVTEDIVMRNNDEFEHLESFHA